MRRHGLVAALLLAVPLGSIANPTGPQVTAGGASFHAAPGALTVTNAPGTIINWQGFSIGTGELTRFQQQSAASAVLNRVVGPDPSSILGTLSSNGRVFLLNPHGIVFGAGSRIDTAGLVASTLNMRDEDFLAGRLKFEGGGHGVLRNEGAIRAGGDIFLVGPRIENAGAIVSDAGSVVLAAGRSVNITSPDAHGVQFALQAPEDSAVNLGTISAANAASMFAGTLRHSGDIRATSASVDAAGRVVLAAQKDAILGGNATISVDNAAGKGGSVQITGERVGLFDSASVSARGASGGGEILIGGDYQGKNPDVPNAARTFVAGGVTLDADATASGNGGKVIVWADEVTRYYGSASVRGGAQRGDGGLVEVSGKQALEFRGRAALEAPQGVAGTLLLDPLNITVQAGAGTLDGHLTPPGDATLAFGDASGVSGTLDTAELAAFTSGTVELQADNDITVNAAVTMASGVNLKLAAINNVNVNSNITTSGGGNLRLEADTDASGAGVITLGSVTINAPLIAGDTGKEFSGKVTIGGNVSFGENAEAFGKLTYSTGGLSVASGRTLTLKGGMDWSFSNSTISGPGTLSLPSGQTLAMTGGGAHNLSGLTFNNAGTVTSSLNNNTLFVNDSAIFNNSGTYRFINGHDAIGTNSGTGTFNNTGTIANNGNFATVVNPTTFTNNGGTLNSNTGNLSLSGGGSHSGSLTMQGTDVRFSGGTHNFADSTTVSGQLNVTGGTSSFGSVTTSGLVSYSGGAMNITSGDTLTLNGGMNWSFINSTISGPGTLSLPSGQTLAMTGGGAHNLSGLTFNNAGTVTSSLNNNTLFVNDSAIFNNSGTYRFINGHDAIGTNSGTGTFSNTGTLESGGAFTNAVSSVTFNNNGGTLSSGASGTLNISTGGSHSNAMTVTNGNVRFTGGTHTFSGASFAGTGAINLQGATFQFGNTNWNRSLAFSSGTVTLQAGTTTTVPSGASIAINHAVGGTGTLSNAGTVDLSGGSIAGSFTNNGGTLNLASGNGTISTGLTSSSGTISPSSGRTLNVAGTGLAWQGGTLAGAGTYNLTGGLSISGSGSRVLNGPTLTVNNLNLPGGSLDVQAGTLNLNGTTTIASGSTLMFSGGTLNLGGALNNNGTFDVNTGTFTLGNGGTSTGTFDAASGATINFSGGTHDLGDGSKLAGAGTIGYTGGTVNITGSGSGTTIASGATLNANGRTFGGTGKLVNEGTFNLATSTVSGALDNKGTLNASGASAVNGALALTSGTLDLAAGGTLTKGGAAANWIGGGITGTGSYSGGLAFSGSGARTLNGPTLNLGATTLPGGSLKVQGGALNVTGTATIASGATLQAAGGAITATTIDVLAGGTLSGTGTIDANVVNAGSVAVGASAGTLTVDGDYTQAASGVLDMELGGTSQGTSYDLLKITGGASLGGTLKLSLIDGFTGAAGNTFDLLTYASRSGDFATFTLPSGYTFSSAPNATFYRMTLDALPSTSTAASSTTASSTTASSGVQALTSSITASLALSMRQLNDSFLVAVESGDQALDEENPLSAGLSCR